jgi:hypothetical protein
MATKKTSTKKNSKRKGIVEDPPVVVGGGNSVDITFNANAVTPPVTPPGRKKFRQPSNITTVVVDDGMGGDLQLIRVKSDTFKVSFF